VYQRKYVVSGFYQPTFLIAIACGKLKNQGQSAENHTPYFDFSVNA
jgi:hypothetical protein